MTLPSPASLAAATVMLATGCSRPEALAWLEDARQELMHAGETCDLAACVEFVTEQHRQYGVAA